jgi:hypothetical protein
VIVIHTEAGLPIFGARFDGFRETWPFTEMSVIHMTHHLLTSGMRYKDF